MTLTKPTEDDAAPDDCLAVAEDLFKSAVLAMIELRLKLEREELVPEKESKAAGTDLSAATLMLMKERQRVVDERRKIAGVAGDDAIDFQAARIEIGRRLASLRGAGED